MPNFFLETHDELDEVQGVRVQVIDERGLRLHIGFVDAELLDDDLLQALVHLLVRQPANLPATTSTPAGFAPGVRQSVGLGTLGRQSAPPDRPPTAVARTPFTNFGAASDPNSFASSTASSMITPAGASPEIRSSNRAMRSTFLSILAI